MIYIYKRKLIFSYQESNKKDQVILKRNQRHLTWPQCHGCTVGSISYPVI